MKKVLVIEAVLFALFMLTMEKMPNIGALCMVAFFVFPIIVLINGILKKKQIRPDFSTNSWVSTKPTPKPTSYTEYLWLQDTEEIGNKFFNAYKEDLEENDDYHMTKKEILDEYYDGDKIYKYEPFSVPFKVEGNKVYSFIKENEWICVGTIKKREIAKYEQSTHTDLQLMPNYFKKVEDDSVEADHGDSYFGLEVTLPVEDPIPKK